MTILTTSCASSNVYVSDICAKNLKIVKLVDPETQSRTTREDLVYNNRVIKSAKCAEKLL